LLARIRAVARRGRPGDGEKKPHVQIGDLEIDRYRFEGPHEGPPGGPHAKEFELLAILAGAPGRVFGREEAARRRVGSGRLRGAAYRRRPRGPAARKFTAAKLPAPGVETVRGVGYRFREPTRS